MVLVTIMKLIVQRYSNINKIKIKLKVDILICLIMKLKEFSFSKWEKINNFNGKKHCWKTSTIPISYANNMEIMIWFSLNSRLWNNILYYVAYNIN